MNIERIHGSERLGVGNFFRRIVDERMKSVDQSRIFFRAGEEKRGVASFAFDSRQRATRAEIRSTSSGKQKEKRRSAEKFRRVCRRSSTPSDWRADREMSNDERGLAIKSDPNCRFKASSRDETTSFDRSQRKGENLFPSSERRSESPLRALGGPRHGSAGETCPFLRSTA